jgi:tetratricopeptide (TPR) repeat protein
MRKTLVRWLVLGIAFMLTRPVAGAQSEEAVKAHGRALRLLAEGDATGAEASAREALAESSRFTPEEEITETPAKRLLFEDMIAEARAKYRRRRGHYFLTLGEALTEQGCWREARKALRRASLLSTTAKPHLVMASHPDLSPAEQVDALLGAFFSNQADQGAVGLKLMETGVFPDRNTLQALIDGKRLLKEVVPDYPGMEVSVSVMPELRSATDRGTFVSTDYLRTGAVLVLYFPADGCSRCSEELDEINRAVSEAREAAKPNFLVAFVNEADLIAARRIARLLALSLEVGRLDRLPDEILPTPGGELRIVTRNGLLQVKLSLVERLRSGEIHRRVQAVLGRLETFEEGELTGPDRAAQELAQLESGGRSLQALRDSIKLAERREAGPASMQNLYRLIDRASRSVLSGLGSPVEIFEILEPLSRLRGAGEAKARLLSALDEGYGQMLLEAVRQIEPEVIRQGAADQGVFQVAVSNPDEDSGDLFIYLQRSFPVDTAMRNFNFVLKATAGGLEVSWVAPENATPLGIQSTSDGTVFLFEELNGCRGLRVVGEDGPVFEGCPVRLMGGEIVEERLALVDPVAESVAPLYYRRKRIATDESETEETALEQGLHLFERGQYREAAAAFEEASREIDPLAPYDDVDIRYNQARCLEAQGKTREALALFETIGDVAYQEWVDERIRILGGGGRP